MFKDKFAALVGEEKAYKYRTLLYCASSASAEFIADCFLCPFEATKIRVQTSKKGTFPTDFASAFNQIRRTEGIHGFYKGIQPLWARQVPYTIIKFMTFERIVEMFYKKVLTKPKADYPMFVQLSVSFVSGFIGGIICAIASHPADTIVSKLNNVKSDKVSTGTAVK